MRQAGISSCRQRGNACESDESNNIHCSRCSSVVLCLCVGVLSVSTVNTAKTAERIIHTARPDATKLSCVVSGNIIFYLFVPSNCFITRFRAAVSVLVGPCCPALLDIVSMQMCILLYYCANKVMMMNMPFWAWASRVQETMHSAGSQTRESTFNRIHRLK